MVRVIRATVVSVFALVMTIPVSEVPVSAEDERHRMVRRELARVGIPSAWRAAVR